MDKQELFKCKVCDFRSKNKNSIKIHLLEHIDNILHNEIKNDGTKHANVKCHKTKAYNIMDQFVANGWYLHESET